MFLRRNLDTIKSLKQNPVLTRGIQLVGSIRFYSHSVEQGHATSSNEPAHGYFFISSQLSLMFLGLKTQHSNPAFINLQCSLSM